MSSSVPFNENSLGTIETEMDAHTPVACIIRQTGCSIWGSVFKNLFIVVKSQAGSIFDESRLSNLIAQRVQSSDFGTSV